MKSHADNCSGMFLIFELFVKGDRIPKNQFAIIAACGQELKLWHHNYGGNHSSMGIRIPEFSLWIGFDEPEIYFWIFSWTVKDLVDIIPCHTMNFSRKLMNHFLIFVFRLFSQRGRRSSNIPAFYKAVRATCQEHFIFFAVEIDHIQKCDFVWRNDYIFLVDLFLGRTFLLGSLIFCSLCQGFLY